MARGGSVALRTPSVIPGFGLTLGFSLSYLALIVLVPLAALLFRSAGFGWREFWALATDERTVAALRLSFGAAFVAASVNAVFGLLIAWVLVRYRFPGRRLSTPSSTFPSHCPRRWRASPSPRCSRRTVGSASCWNRSA